MEKIAYPSPVDITKFSDAIKNPNVLYGLPEHVIYCKKCVISNQRPSSVVEYKNTIKSNKTTIQIGADGICDACRYAEIKHTTIDWREREDALRELCEKHRKSDGSYDCILSLIHI